MISAKIQELMPDIKNTLNKNLDTVMQKYLEIKFDISGVYSLSLNNFVYDLCLMIHMADEKAILCGIWLQNFDLQFFSLDAGMFENKGFMHTNIIRRKRNKPDCFRYSGMNLLLPVLFTLKQIKKLLNVPNYCMLLSKFHQKTLPINPGITSVKLYVKTSSLSNLKTLLMGTKPVASFIKHSLSASDILINDL